jgi:hypothetical protein
MRQPIVYFLLASVLLIQSVLPAASAQTLTQTEEKQTADDSLIAERTLVARSAYTELADIARSSEDDQTRSEPARRRPVPPPPPRIQYPRGRSHGAMWQQRGNGRHALIGAVIGFGIGAALGVKGNKDQHARVTAPVLFGSVGALIGAAVGAGHP